LSEFSGTWPRSGMTRSGTAFLLRPLVPVTYVTDSGLWPTPVAHDDGNTPEAHMAMKQRMKGGPRNTITSLTVMVKAIEDGLWPTPTASEHTGPGHASKGGKNLRTVVAESEMLPTPKASDADRGERGDLLAIVNERPNRHSGGMLPTPTASRRTGLQSHGVNKVRGQLNPTWVEWLMGFPLGWTVLDPSETPSSPRSLKK
jgi:hypothetical protein